MVIGYCRVSTKQQAKDGNSLEAQEKAILERYADARIYREAYTGTTTSTHKGNRLEVFVKLEGYNHLGPQGTCMLSVGVAAFAFQVIPFNGSYHVLGQSQVAAGGITKKDRWRGRADLCRPRPSHHQSTLWVFLACGGEESG